MSTILDRIVATKREEVIAAKSRRDLTVLKDLAEHAPAPRDFLGALRGHDRVRLIAEVKKASPSKGLIREDFNPLAIARSYESAGAAAISVLTDEPFFQGRLDYLTDIRNAVEIPVLRKDFILDEYQVYEARVAGADAVLLIAECLDQEKLLELYGLINQLGMTALIEIYDPSNLDRVLATGTPLIGVNNRDLHTFALDLGHVVRLKEQMPTDITVVAESGIFTPADVQFVAQAGIHAMLVGESLMRQPNVEEAVRILLDY